MLMIVIIRLSPYKCKSRQNSDDRQLISTSIARVFPVDKYDKYSINKVIIRFTNGIAFSLTH